MIGEFIMAITINSEAKLIGKSAAGLSTNSPVSRVPTFQVKQVDSPEIADIKQSQKRSSATMNAEKVKKQLDAAVEQLNNMSVNSGRGLKFKVDPSLGRLVITITNTETGDLVRTITTKIALNASASEEAFKGLILDSRA